MELISTLWGAGSRRYGPGARQPLTQAFPWDWRHLAWRGFLVVYCLHEGGLMVSLLEGRRVLVVDSHRPSAEDVAHILEKHAAVTEIALTGEEAVEKARGSRPDIVLMALELERGMDGLLAAQEMRQFDVPVVFLVTGMASETVEKIRSVGGYGYVPKGAGEPILVFTVELALQLRKARTWVEMYRQLLENSLVEMYFFHPRTLGLIAVNRGARENLGYTMEDLSDMTPLDLMPELDHQRLGTLIAPLLHGEKEQVAVTTVHRRKDGSLYPVEVYLQRYEHDGEEICAAVVFDLTARQQMEDELRRREVTLKAITDSAQEAIILLDSRGKVSFWNPAAERMFGYSQEEILGKQFHRLVAPEEISRRAWERTFQRFHRSKKPRADGKPIQLSARDRSGRQVDLEVSLSRLSNGKVWYTLVVARDISERKRLEEEKKRKEERLRLMLNGIPSPAWLISREGQILAQNQAAETLFKSRVGDFCWRSIFGSGVYAQEHQEAAEKSGSRLPAGRCYFCRAEEALDNNEPVNSEVQLGGSIWATWWIPAGDNLYIHYATDISKFKKMEEELRRRGEYLDILLTSVPVGVLTVDVGSNRIEDANLEAAVMIGLAPNDIWGKTCGEFFVCFRDGCPVKDRGEELIRTEQVLRAADGTAIPVLKTVKRLQTASGEKCIEAFMDLSDRKKLEEELRCLSTTDCLTGAYNRRYFIEAVEQEIGRARRSGQPFALVMIDLDRFKSINDCLGHAAGDLVLKNFVDVIRRRIRKTDCLARLGGDEFALLLPYTTAEGAVRLAEELRQHLRGLVVPGVGRITASFGVAGYRPGDTVDSLLQRADARLYEAKAVGRDMVRGEREGILLEELPPD